MWKLFFETCDLLCGLIPSRGLREKVRREKLYDWRRKYNALRQAFPGLSFRHTKMIKGGWNIGFIVDNKYVFKIRKRYDKNVPQTRIMREKRITDAFAAISPLRIPHIEIVEADGYMFYKYDFIPGRNLNTFSQKVIEEHAWEWGRQLAEFINAVHHSRPAEIEDLREGDGDGWNHNDICNNIIVNPDTMQITGIIDWEYAGWGVLDTEFNNCVRFSKKIEKSQILIPIKMFYHVLQKIKK